MSGAETVVALMVVAGAAKTGQGVLQSEAAGAREEAINMEREQRYLQYQQKTMANYELTNKILDSQLAQGSAKGIGLGSSSFEAIQRETTNVSAKKQKNLNLEEDIFERNAKIEKQNVQDTLAAQLFGDTASFAEEAAGAYTKMP